MAVEQQPLYLFLFVFCKYFDMPGTPRRAVVVVVVVGGGG